jgi:penicillin-binding protein 1A
MPSKPPSNTPNTASRSLILVWSLRLLGWGLGLALAGIVALAMVIGVALAVAYPNLPDISELSDYRPKLPLRVFSAEGTLLAEFGEGHSAGHERRRTGD